ncbi:hypothetical protein ACFWBN_03180 [Streptomyces sp. NPDC059989]|uniref:hypothetical protein n=1 Tax=Streptomyces sp. NPDC059989 TaxID=3347026 RepID=UPI0036AC798E
MRSVVRAAALTGAVGALLLLTTPASQAAPSAASACITATQTEDYGRGEITVCPQSDGTVRLTGWVEDLKPGGGWLNPDGYCAGWWLQEGGVNGEFGPYVCPHIDPARKPTRTFDTVITPEAPVVGVTLTRFGV